MPPGEVVPAVLEEVASRLRETHGFGAVSLGERLQGGYANDLFRVTADGEALVLRLQPPPVVEEDVRWEHGLTRELARRLPEVLAPIASRGGDTLFRVSDRVGWLLPFAAGRPADPRREADRRAAARALGRLHAAGAALEPPPRPRLRPIAQLEWPAFVAVPELAPWHTTIACERAWAIEEVARIARSRHPRPSIAHGDYFPGNVLVDGDAVTAVIDWEEAQADWPSWDLANALGTFCSDEDAALDPGACRRFLAAYRAAGGTAPPEEDDLLVPFVRIKRILEVLRAPTDREPRWDHQRRNLRSLERLAHLELRRP